MALTDTGAGGVASSFADQPGPVRIAAGNSERLTSLDAIRGIAALIVVIGHSLDEAIRLMPPGLPVRDLLDAVFIELLSLGRVGVVAFFCVSGYVIPFSFAHRRPVESFLIARFFRLYPAYWVSIIGAIAVAIIVAGEAPAGLQILANITMVQAVLGHEDLIGVYWTLFYELVFYGMCLGAFLIKRMEDPRYLVAIITLFSGIGLIAAWLRYSAIAPGVPIGLFVFLAIMHLGTLARTADRNSHPLAKRYFAIGMAIVLVTSGPIVSIGFIQHAASQRLLADVVSLYAGIALFFALRRSTGLATPSLIWLGLISYSLYLMHPLCLTLVVTVARYMDFPVSALLAVTAIPLTSILLAAVTQRLVEDPSNRLGKTLRKRLPA